MRVETYILGDIEVKKTGRRAEKTRPGSQIAKIELVEVTPVNDYDGTWKKWVNPASLFNIVTDTPTQS